MNKKEQKKNKSLVYLLPMISTQPEIIIKNLVTNNTAFINTYFHSETDLDYDNNYKNRIYLVFDKSKIKQEFANLLGESHNYIRADFNNELLIFTFKIPDIYLNDFLLFKEGKYSKFSTEYKHLLLQSWPNTKNLRDVLYPRKENIEQLKIILRTREKITETLSKPDQIKETFKMSNYFKIDNNDSTRKNN